MRVAHLSLQLDRLGRAPEQLLADWSTLPDVAEAVAGAGAQVIVVVAAQAESSLERRGVTYRFLETRDLSVLRQERPYFGLRAMWRVVTRFNADVVHVHGLSFPLQTRLLTKAVQGTPVVVQDHASHPPRGWKRFLHRWGFADVAGAIFTARAQAQPFFEAEVIRRDLPVFEVVEGSTAFTPGDQSVARARTGLGGDPCLLWLGHLNQNKDPLTVIEGFSRARPSLPDPHFWCCFRSAPLMAAVRARIDRDPTLVQRVHLLGPRSHGDVEPLLQAADFLVQGSHVEGSGYAVIEALACGTTPLVTDIPSFRRITREGAVGALSRPGDAESMARALVAWSRRDRQSLRLAARAHFERELSFDAIGSQLRSAYETLVRAR